MRTSLPLLLLFVTFFIASPSSPPSPPSLHAQGFPAPSDASTPPAPPAPPAPLLSDTDPSLSSLPTPKIICTTDRIQWRVTIPSIRAEVQTIVAPLLSIIDELKARPHWRIRIEIHTAPQGSALYNLRLSQKRALEVRHFFIQRGLPASRITAQGYGKYCPLMSSLRKGRQRNSRIQIVLLEGEFSVSPSGSSDLSPIFFAFQQKTLPSEASGLLDRIAEKMTQNPALRLSIRGHTSPEENKYSLLICRQRARAVAASLQARGIAAERLVLQHYGASMPIDSNRTQAGRAKNQRVDLRFLP